jgi:hypothetical protein
METLNRISIICPRCLFCSGCVGFPFRWRGGLGAWWCVQREAIVRGNLLWMLLVAGGQTQVDESTYFDLRWIQFTSLG